MTTELHPPSNLFIYSKTKGLIVNVGLKLEWPMNL